MSELQRHAISLLLCAALALVLALCGHEIGYHRGEAQATAAAKARAAKIDADHAEALLQATEREQTLERRLIADLQAPQTQFNQETRDAQQTRARAAAELRAGTVRVSIPAYCPGPAGGAAGTRTDPPTAGGDRHPTRAELAPETGLDLAAIADDGDDSVRQLNACIDSYNTVRARYNAAAADPGHAQTH